MEFGIAFGGDGARTRRRRLIGMTAAACLVVAGFVVASQAHEAAASADLVRAKDAAVAAVGNRIGIGAAGVDLGALQAAAAAEAAERAAASVQALADESSAVLGAPAVAELLDAQQRLRDAASSWPSEVLAARTELFAARDRLSAALAAHREQEAARIAAEAASAAAAEASEAAGASNPQDGPSDVIGTPDAAPVVPTEPAATPLSFEERYPGLSPAPSPEECGPCLGKPMYPIEYNGSWFWGCDG